MRAVQDSWTIPTDDERAAGFTAAASVADRTEGDPTDTVRVAVGRKVVLVDGILVDREQLHRLLRAAEQAEAKRLGDAGWRAIGHGYWVEGPGFGPSRTKDEALALLDGEVRRAS
mgnify:CR=1 FL=1